MKFRRFWLVIVSVLMVLVVAACGDDDDSSDGGGGGSNDNPLANARTVEATQEMRLNHGYFGIKTRWSDDSTRAALLGSGGVLIFNMDALDAEPLFIPVRSEVLDAEFSPDGSHLVLIRKAEETGSLEGDSPDEFVERYATSTGEQVAVGRYEDSQRLDLNEAAGVVAVAARETVYILDATTLEEIEAIDVEDYEYVEAVALSDDGNLVAMGSVTINQRGTIYNRTTQEFISQELSTPINQVVFSPDNSQIAFGYLGYIAIYDIASGEVINSTSEIGTTDDGRFAYDGEGNLMVARQARTFIYTTTFEEVTRFAGIVSPNQQYYLANRWGERENVAIGAADSEEPLITFDTVALWNDVRVINDGSQLLAHDGDRGYFYIYSTADGTLQETIAKDEGRAFNILEAVSPDGLYYAVDSGSFSEPSITIWHLPTWENTVIAGVQADAIAWSPDGTHIATLTADGQEQTIASLVNVSTGEIVWTRTYLHAETDFMVGLVQGLIFVDNQRILALKGDFSHVLDVATGDIKQTLTYAEGKSPEGVVITADGSTIVLITRLASDDEIGGDILFMDAETLAVEDSIEFVSRSLVGVNMPSTMRLSSDGSTLVVITGAIMANKLHFVDMASRQVVLSTELPIIHITELGLISPDGRRFAITDWHSVGYIFSVAE